MADVRITAAAKAHLLGIWEYSAAQWNDDQADAYLREIKTAFDRLAENPRLGTHRPEIATGYRSFPSGKHVIFYTLDKKDDAINIIGVLHARMEVRSHLE
jgi:toxin ParE1/3/4